MLNPTTQGPHLARDIAAFVELPAAVTTAMDAYAAALDDTEPVESFAFECMTIDPKDVPALIERAAQGKIARDAIPVVRGEIADLLARRIIREIAAAGAEIIEKARPVFMTAAEVYTNAVAALPANTSPEALVNAGSGVVALYEQATGAAATLDKLRRIRDELATLGVRAPGDQRVEQWTRVLDLEDADAIDWAQRARSAGPLGSWQGLLAAKGVRRLWWPSIAEHTEAVARVSATLPKRPAKKDPTINIGGPKVAA